MRFKEFIKEQEQTPPRPDTQNYYVLVVFDDEGKPVYFGPIPDDLRNDPELMRRTAEYWMSQDYPDRTIKNMFLSGPGGTQSPLDVAALDPAPQDDGEIPIPGEDDVSGDSEVKPPESDPDKTEIDPEEREDEPTEPEETPTETPPEETPTETPPEETPTETPPEETPTETPPTETEPEPEISDVTMMNAQEVIDQQNAWADRVDANRDNLHDETGEQVNRMDNNMNYVDVDGNPVGPTINLPGGGGNEGEAGDEGISGEEGGLPGDQEEAIPSIIEQLRQGLFGAGTNENKVLGALQRIQSREHFNAVVEMYQQEFGSNVIEDIISDYQREPRSAENIAQINSVIVPFGYRFVYPEYGLGRLAFAEANENAIESDEADKTILNPDAGLYDPIEIVYMGYVYQVDPSERPLQMSLMLKDDELASPRSMQDVVGMRFLKFAGVITDEINRRQEEAYGDLEDAVLPNDQHIFLSIDIANNETGEMEATPFLAAIYDGRRIAVSKNPFPDGNYYYIRLPYGARPGMARVTITNVNKRDFRRMRDRDMISQIENFEAGN